MLIKHLQQCLAYKNITRYHKRKYSFVAMSSTVVIFLKIKNSPYSYHAAHITCFSLILNITWKR